MWLMCTGEFDNEKITAREKRKLRREFSQLGRDSVRYNVQIGPGLLRARVLVRKRWTAEEVSQLLAGETKHTCSGYREKARSFGTAK
jgi:hypothetical protein